MDTKEMNKLNDQRRRKTIALHACMHRNEIDPKGPCHIYIYIIGTYIYLGPSVCDLPITWITRNLRWLCAASADVRCPRTWLKLGWQSMILNNYTCIFPHILQYIYIYIHMYTCCIHESTHVSASPSYKLVKPSNYSYIMLYLSLKPG